MSQAKAKCSQKLASEQLHNSVTKVLHYDASNTEDTSHTDRLFTPDHVRYQAGCKGRSEEANRGGGIEDLLVACRDEEFAIDLFAEFLEEWCDREEVADCAVLVAKVDG